jgi:NADH-quinone oxidoreductase subunit G
MTITAGPDLVTVTIDGIELSVPKGTLLVEAAKQIHRDIPVYCYHTKLGPAGLCRICLVEIEGTPKLQIACNTQVADKMIVRTVGEKAEEGRRAVLELLLVNHPLDCPICDKGGECDLQDYAMAYGQGASRSAEPKSSKPKAVDLGPTIVLDEERCVLCLRCVRFDDLITHERSLRTEDRGAQAIIATATGQPYVSDFSGNVTELCPVGALTSKTYRFKSRPWDNHRTTTTCTQCSVGCPMHVDQRVGTIARTMSVEEDVAISDGWLCDRGRYNVGYVADERRITQPLYKQDGQFVQIGWDDAIAMWAKSLKETIAARGAAGVGAIGGGRLLNEEAFLLQHIYRALGVGNLDWRAGRQQRAHPGASGGTHVELENAQVIVTFGRTPAQLAPILDLRIRKAVAHHGAVLFAIGDHAASSVLPAKRFATFAEAAAAFPASAARIALVWDGTSPAEAPSVAAWSASSAAAGKTVRTYIVSEQANARGAESLGLLPRVGALDTGAMLRAARDGKIGSLVLMGVNPVLHWPDRELAIAALEATPFVVVSELFRTETAELATLILPACSAFEKSGSTTDLAGEIRPVVAGVPAPEGALADGDMLVALADALEIALPFPDEIERRVRDAIAVVPEIPEFAPAANAPASGLRIVIESTIFSGGGTVAHDARLGELRTAPRATFHPETAARLGLADGDAVDLGTGERVLSSLTVAIDPRIPVESVAVVAGLPNANVNVLTPSDPVTVVAHRPARVLAEAP